MTDEEIKQAAYEYINSDAVRPENMQLAFGDFIAGAHSRDVEIAYLTYRLNDTAEKLQTVIAERDNLRNPWISVDERLPEDDRDYLFMGNHIPVCLGSYYSNSLSGAVWSCDDGYWTPAEEVTHWMPIPELPNKGE